MVKNSPQGCTTEKTSLGLSNYRNSDHLPTQKRGPLLLSQCLMLRKEGTSSQLILDVNENVWKMLIFPLHLFRTLKFLHFLELGVNVCLSSRVVSSLQMNWVRVGRSRRHNITLTTKLDKNLRYHDGRQDSPFRKQHHLKSRRRLFPSLTHLFKNGKRLEKRHGNELQLSFYSVVSKATTRYFSGVEHIPVVIFMISREDSLITYGLRDFRYF